MNRRLFRTYQHTVYTAGGVAFRIGRRSPAIDILLRQSRVRTAVLLGADNPFSRRMPLGWNVRSRQRLQERLRRRTTILGDGRLRNWAEHHMLVLGPIRPSIRIARLMRQNGIVILRLGQPVILSTTFSITCPRDW